MKYDAKHPDRKRWTCLICWTVRGVNVEYVTKPLTFDNRSVSAILTVVCPDPGCGYEVRLIL